MKQSRNYYEILQVDFSADRSDITSSYKKLCKLYHPDVNSAPFALELMKEINSAYFVLSDEKRRAEYNLIVVPGRAAAGAGARNPAGGGTSVNEDNMARLAVSRYFDCLMRMEYEKAYALISSYDRKYVTIQSFCEWRRAVANLFSVREFSVRTEAGSSRVTLEGGKTVFARKCFVTVTEKNLSTKLVQQYQTSKHVVCEQGSWRVFLGYRDLSEIAKIFEDISLEREKGEMARHWEEYCTDTCREIRLPSLAGLLKQASREIYRYKRYGQPITVARFALKVRGPAASAQLADAMELVADTMTSSLRETDIPAYIGDGVFVVLFVEMKKKYAADIIGRLADSIRHNLKGIKQECGLDYSFTHYSGGQLRPYIDKLAEK